MSNTPIIQEPKITIEFTKIPFTGIGGNFWLTPAATGFSIIAMITMIASFCFCPEIGITTHLVALFLIVALCLVALCYIIYKFESVRVAYRIEEAKATAALYRKLIEETEIRNIKIQEKNLSK